MRRLHHHEGLSDADQGAAVALGNFDGVHLGHQSVLALARAAAAERAVPFGVVTFEPHPRAYFAPGAPPFRLMTADSRARRLERLGVARLYELGFDAALAALTPEAFALDVLGSGLGVRHVVVGADFRFGHDRAGDAAALEALGAAAGFGVSVAPLVGDGGRDFSSTAIRTALAEGRPEEAARMLGHWHRIEGPVLHGDKRGRALGFPTANLSLEGLHVPRLGVYAVLVDVLGGPHRGRYPGVASIGVRPTFGGDAAPSLEVHLFDFSGDLYGTEVSVALVAYQRPEIAFSDVGALVVQMQADSAEARGHLDAVRRRG